MGVGDDGDRVPLFLSLSLVPTFLRFRPQCVLVHSDLFLVRSVFSLVFDFVFVVLLRRSPPPPLLSSVEVLSSR